MAETINMPKLGFDMAEGTLVRWVKKTGEQVNKGEVLAEIETDKATVEVESPASGVVRKLLVDEGAVVPVNMPIAVVGRAEEIIEDMIQRNEQTRKIESKPVQVGTGEKPAPRLEAAPAPADGPMKASPLAKKMASERKVDLSHVRGTGPGGRIVRRDIEQVMDRVPESQRGLAGLTNRMTIENNQTDESIGLTKLRQAIARRMAESKTSIPHFYVTHEYKMDRLLDIRRQLNDILQENEKVSVNDVIVKATALTLRQFPNLNATFLGDQLIRHGHINIGVAVAVEGGLLTVVCRDADAKPMRQIAVEIKEMAGRAREGKVRTDDIEGSTFSISNLGMFDVENFLAIINPPEAGILAVGSAREVAVVEGGVVKAGWRMKAAISVDHRVSDGVEAARFMQAVGVYLEEPVRLMV